MMGLGMLRNNRVAMKLFLSTYQPLRTPRTSQTSLQGLIPPCASQACRRVVQIAAMELLRQLLVAVAVGMLLQAELQIPASPARPSLTQSQTNLQAPCQTRLPLTPAIALAEFARMGLSHGAHLRSHAGPAERMGRSIADAGSMRSLLGQVVSAHWA